MNKQIFSSLELVRHCFIASAFVVVPVSRSHQLGIFPGVFNCGFSYLSHRRNEEKLDNLI